MDNQHRKDLIQLCKVLVIAAFEYTKQREEVSEYIDTKELILKELTELQEDKD